jgi:hypothetical protein
VIVWELLRNDRSRDRLVFLEHRAGIEPANTGFADQRVSHFATGALGSRVRADTGELTYNLLCLLVAAYFGCAVVRR